MANEKNIEEYLINRKDTSTSPLEYENLRSRGIEITQKLSGDLWTDYNLHDPGLTILEYICYALTDLAYRTNFKIEDILTESSGKINKEKNLFYTGREILSTNPVTINDFRKLIIDQVPEVYNVWLEPLFSKNKMQYGKGLYKVLIQLNPRVVGEMQKMQSEKEREAIQNAIIRKVKSCVNAARNLCEDFEEFIVLKPREIKVYGSILIDGDEKLPEEVLGSVHLAIFKVLNPEIRFFSEHELKQMGRSSEDINQGPELGNGFLMDETLLARSRFIDPTDLLRAVTGIKGVTLIQELFIEVDGRQYDRELCRIDKEEFLYYNFNSSQPLIRLFNEGFEIPIKQSLLGSILNLKIDSLLRIKRSVDETEAAKEQQEFNGIPIIGTHRDLSRYTSIQNLFPEIYRLKESLEERTAAEESQVSIQGIAQVKQLKAFLMMFEQVIANYLAQLANIDNVYSTGIDEANCYTYFTQPIFNVPGADKIIQAYNNGIQEVNTLTWNNFKNDSANAYTRFLREKTETDNAFIKRKHKVFNHLLSRFNITLPQYPLQLFQKTYNCDQAEGRLTSSLKWKKNILEELDYFLKNRNQAFNYCQPWEKRELGGFQQWLLRLLYIGVDRPKKASISEINTLCPEMAKISFVDSGSKSSSKDPQTPQSFYIVNQDGSDLKVLGKTGNVLKNISVSFFAEGIDPKNYLIVQDPGTKEQLLIYKAPADSYWRELGRYNDFYVAIKARNDFIDELRNINLESEGFHLVEHILLRPDLQTPRYGFSVLDEFDHPLCVHHDWSSFSERDKHLEKLIKYASRPYNRGYEDMEKEFEGLCRIAIEHNQAPANFVQPSLLRYRFKEKKESLEQIYSRFLDNLKKIGDNQAYARMKIRSHVKGISGTLIDEDFFSFRMTVVLPSWPARFQDSTFREFVEKTFVDNCPAHIRLDFKWLKISEMKAFESLYFDWLTAINKNKSSIEILELADALINMLLPEETGQEAGQH